MEEHIFIVPAPNPVPNHLTLLPKKHILMMFSKPDKSMRSKP
jgi:hypothetical protein